MLEAEIVVQPPRGVLLDDETGAAALADPRPGFTRPAEITLVAVGFQWIGIFRSIRCLRARHG